MSPTLCMDLICLCVCLPPAQNWLKTKKLADLDAVDFKELKSRGFSDSQIGRAVGECSKGGKVDRLKG